MRTLHFGLHVADLERGSDDLRTAWITDPDGNRIQLVQWPAGHPDGLTAADWSG
jgi:lactoylglutathione lyase